MEKKQDNHIFSGMSRDMSISKQKAEFLWDARNIRLTARDRESMLSMTNEKGTENTGISVEGKYLGHCVLGKYLVVFTHKDSDRIIRIEKDNEEFRKVSLYEGNLNFSSEHPIETLGVYENESIQKVYWTDGYNQPRMINIVADKTYHSDSFDFVQTLQLNETVSIKKILDGNGLFPSGVIQYAFTYYNKYGQETALFHISPIQYINYNNRAGSPDETIAVSFNITISDIDTRFDYLRCYSILRTSLDGTPIVKRVIDIELSTIDSSNKTSFTDNGLIGDNVDASKLLYMGGEEITAETISQKDGFVFLGNISLLRKSLHKKMKNFIGKDSTFKNFISSSYKSVYIKKHTIESDYYTWDNTLNATDENNNSIYSAGFKYMEHYRLGIQFQYKTGNWSEPIYIGDIVENNAPNKDSDKYNIPVFSLDVTKADFNDTDEGKQINYIDDAIAKGYVKVRPVVVYPKINDRLVLFQGLVCPTVYGITNRENNTPYAQSSWFLRPFYAGGHPDKEYTLRGEYNYCNLSPSIMSINNRGKKLSYINSEHNTTLYSGRDNGSEIQGVPERFSYCSYKFALASADDGEHSYEGINSYLKTIGGQRVSVKVKGIPVRKNYDSGIINNGTEYDIENNDFIDSIQQFTNVYCVDQNILNLHSPEQALSEYFNTLSLANYKFRINGTAWFNSSVGDIDIKTKTGVSKDGKGFVKPPLHEDSNYDTAFTLASGLFYNDYLIDDTQDGTIKAYGEENYPFSFMVYPWQKEGSLNNDINRDAATSVLDKKIISNLKFASETTFITSVEKPISDSALCNELINSLTKLSVEQESSKINYYGNVDTIITTSIPYGAVVSPGYSNQEADDPKEGEILDPSNNYPINFKQVQFLTYTNKKQFFFNTDYTNPSTAKWFGTEKGFNNQYVSKDTNNPSSLYINFRSVIDAIGNKDEGSLRAMKSPIRMKYKTTPHVVLALKDNDYLDYNNVGAIRNKSNTYLSIGELYRDANPNTDFGGNSEDALKNNIWYPAGEAVKLSDFDNKPSVSIVYSYGDTWYQRYDLLKTYPYSNEDTNQLVEIGSFMVESRINLDGRYDKNRGLDSNLHINDTNFNKLNNVYSQLDNFFTYSILDQDFYSLNDFPTSVVWSQIKNPGDIIDSWSNINMASIVNADGTKGKITAIRKFKDTLYCFQDYAVSKLLFNEKTAISTTDGTPIEIANSNRCDGFQYLSTSMGCSNKYTINNEGNALYFMDSINKNLFTLSAEGHKSISIANGLSIWFGQQGYSKWIPDSENARSFYDKNKNDLYIFNEKECLCFSEILDKFISFYDYKNTDAVFNIDSGLYAIQGEKLWQMNKGKSNVFFNNEDPEESSFTYISNDTPATKIFTNIDMNVDFYKNENTLDDFRIFDSIRVYNEYQDTNERVLNSTLAKKKFRIWHIEIPRDFTHKMDRIRNQWCKINFKWKPSEEYAHFELHNLSTTYFI